VYQKIENATVFFSFRADDVAENLLA